MTDTARTGIHIRRFLETDRAYVAATWLDSFADSPLARSLGRRRYDLRWQPLIRELLRMSTVLIATPSDDPDLIAGWIAFGFDDREGSLVHYVYVRDSLRGFGVGSRLLTEALGGSSRWTYTHRTLDSQRITAHWRAHRDRRQPTYDFTVLPFGRT